MSAISQAKRLQAPFEPPADLSLPESMYSFEAALEASIRRALLRPVRDQLYAVARANHDEDEAVAYMALNIAYAEACRDLARAWLWLCGANFQESGRWNIDQREHELTMWLVMNPDQP
jgi:hypothetical protein